MSTMDKAKDAASSAAADAKQAGSDAAVAVGLKEKPADQKVKDGLSDAAASVQEAADGAKAKVNDAADKASS